MAEARLISLTLAQFRVRVKVKGKWKAAKSTGKSFVVPKTATAYRVDFRPATSWIRVGHFDKKKSKNPKYLSRKSLLKVLRKDSTKHKYKTAAQIITEKLGPNWQVRPRAQRLLPPWGDTNVFFVKEADLKKEWRQIAIWFAFEAEGFSDGTPVGDGKAYYVDAAYQDVEARKLSPSLDLERFRELVEPLVIGVDSEIELHNKNKDRKFDWKPSYILLAVEGVEFERKTVFTKGAGGEISRKDRVRRLEPRFRSRRKVSKAKSNHRV